MKIKSKHIISILLAVAVIPPLIGSCCTKFIPSAYADDEPQEQTTQFQMVDEQEYLRSFALSSTSPQETINASDILSDTRYTAYAPSPDMPFDQYQDFMDLLNYEASQGLFNPDLINSIRSDELIKSAYAERVKSLVDYANQSTSGGTQETLKNAYAFIAKRKVFYPNSNAFEVDYLYYWKDANRTSPTLEGINLGDFYIQPNTIVLCRYNSNGYSTVSYTTTDQIPFYLSTTSNDKPCYWQLERSGSFSCYNSEGTVETITWNNFHVDPKRNRFVSSPSVNSITSNFLVNTYENYSTRYNAGFGDIMTNAQCFISNSVNPDTGQITIDANMGVGDVDWYITSFGNFSNNNLSAFSSDLNDLTAQKAPTFKVINNFTTGAKLTTNNVSNYSDYGITYNSSTNEFELDVDALGVALANELDTTFKPIFDGVYGAQPDIGLAFTDNTNNYLDIVDDYVVDLINQQYPPSNITRPLVPVVTTLSQWNLLPTYTTETVPQYVLDTVDDVNTSIVDLTDAMEITGIFMLLALLGLLIYAIF